MPSITYWNRLEPRARSTDLANALAARVRDPAWFLARQWQLGEFAGEDAASPAYVRIQAQITPMTAWGVAGQPPQPLAPDVPIERPTTAEPFSPEDLSLAVETAQTFDRLLQDLGADDLRPYFLEAYPIAAAVPDDDPRTARMRALWRGRAYDGIAIVVAGVPVTAAAIPGTVPEARRALAEQAIAQLVAWIAELYGTLGPEDPAAWRPDRLDYALHVYATAPAGGGTAAHEVMLAAEPDRDGDLEWFAFDRAPGVFPSGVPAPATAEIIRRAVIPGHVKFRGMPNERFWDFEDGRVDFGGLRPDRRDLASMILMDFMLVHGNDWFLVPFEQPVGTLCRTTLTVVDVFGGRTVVPRADAVPAPPSARWTMFSTTDGGALADFFLLPASASASVDEGPPLEEVRFLRDETANLVWAIEHVTEGHLGRPWPGHERASTDTTQPSPGTSSIAGLRYQIQSRVPANWIPFQPVALPPLSSGQIALERASLVDPDGPPGTPPTLPDPLGKILSPRAVPPGQPYRVREEELPREGRHVSRVVRRSRGVDGATHLWASRRRGIGGGEGWSGLRYDLVEPVEMLPEE